MGSSLFPNYDIEKKPYLELKYWKIYKGSNKTTKQCVSVFNFEKKNLDKKPEKERENILTYLRKEPESLIKGKNKHKNFLTIIEPLSEDNSSMGFITEYVEYNLTSWVNNYHPSNFEIKYIIYQLISVVDFMITEYKISHNNLSTNNIFLTGDNFLKISGFMFTTNFSKNNTYINSGLNQNIIESMCDLKYFAPEIIINSEMIY